MEILALYQQPRVFLVDLEKKLSVLKEECAKKQIEIKEVNLKKTSLMTTPTGKNFLAALIGFNLRKLRGEGGCMKI